MDNEFTAYDNVSKLPVTQLLYKDWTDTLKSETFYFYNSYQYFSGTNYLMCGK